MLAVKSLMSVNLLVSKVAKVIKGCLAEGEKNKKKVGAVANCVPDWTIGYARVKVDFLTKVLV